MAALIVLLGLRRFDIVSQEPAVVGFVTGLAVAVVLAVANYRKRSTG